MLVAGLYGCYRDDATLADMKRRAWLKLGLGSSALLAALGLGVSMSIRPGFDDGKLSPAARSVVTAIATAVLDGRLPIDDSARAVALSSFIQRFEGAIANFPRAVQAEISELLMVLGTTPGRMGLMGLSSDWTGTSTGELQQALQRMRVSTWSLRVQAYHALRDLTHGAYYADAGTWSDLQYPGPRAV